MYKTISGVYEKGIVKLLEPVDFSEATPVFITFLNEKIPEVDYLSPQEIVNLAKERAGKLKKAGISKKAIFNNLLSVIEDIRMDAIERGAAIND